jgi:hypothetical protein
LSHGFRLPGGRRHQRQIGFEVDRRLIGKCRIQTMAIVDLFEECPIADRAWSREARPSTSSCLSIFMKLSALALS